MLPAQLQARVRSLFEVPEEAECRLWQRYMTNTYELLNKQSETISEAGLYGGQVGVAWVWLVYNHIHVCLCS